MEGSIKEVWTGNEPGEDSSDVGWTGVDHQIGEKGDQTRDGFVYLGGMVKEDGRSEVEIRRLIHAGANAWKKIEA